MLVVGMVAIGGVVFLLSGNEMIAARSIAAPGTWTEMVQSQRQPAGQLAVALTRRESEL